MAFYLNDEARSLATPLTLQTLVTDLGLAERRGIALAVNDTVVSRAQWPARLIVDGDRVVIIQAAQGG
jgi:sulfur carrier protein